MLLMRYARLAIIDQMPLFLIILGLAQACSPPSASTGLYVQAGADQVLADGSDCYPFDSISAAISTLTLAGGKIVAVPGTAPWPMGELVIQAAVTLEGQGGHFLMDASLKVETNAIFVLEHVVLETLRGANFSVKGTLSIQGSTLQSLLNDFASVSGYLEILASHVITSLGTLATLSTFGASVKFQDSDFSNFSTAIDFQAATLSASPNVASSILIDNCTFAHFKTALKISDDRTIFSGVYTGVSTLTLDKVKFEDFSEIGLWGNVYFWKVRIANSVFRRGVIGIQLGLNDQDHVITSSEFLNLDHSVNITNLAGSLSLSSCSFTQTSQSILLTKGTGSSWLSASHCSFSDIGNSTSMGPVIFAQNAGKVSLLNSQVQNGRGKKGGSVAVFSSAQVEIIDCSLSNLEADQGGVIYIEYTKVKVQRTEVDIAKSKGSAFYVYQQTMTFENITVRRTYSEVYLFYSYESAVVWTNNLIENSGSKEIFMNLRSSAPIYIKNTEYRNISLGVSFVMPTAAMTYYFDNITISVEEEGMSKTLLYNFGTLISFTRSTFSGAMQTFVGGVGPAGVTVMADCLLKDLHVVTLFATGSAVLRVFNSTIRNVQISDSRASRLSTTQVQFVNVTISGVKGQFLSCTQSTLSFTLLVVTNCTVPLNYYFIEVLQSDLTFTATVFDLVTLSAASALISASLQSSLTVSASSFSRITMPSSKGIIIVEQSVVQFTQIQVRLLTSTFLSATESVLVVNHSSFSDIGLLTPSQFDGGVVNGLQMLGVSLSNCSFTHMHARNGGALFISYTNPNKASIYRQMGPEGYVSISHCVFDTCESSGDGGAVYLNYATATVNDSRFTNNTAEDSGGALALYCDPAELQFTCFYYINYSDFTSNTAHSSGGAIKYDKIKPVLTNITSNSNTAAYGEFLAAFPIELRYMQNGVALPLSTLNGESGFVFPQAIQLGLFDELNQLIASDSSSQGSLVTSNSSALISGVQTVSAKNGVFSFARLSVTDVPGSLINLKATSTAIDYSNPNPNTKDQSSHLPVHLHLRACYTGEIIKNSVCNVCAAGTFSFNTTDPVCKSCPTGLTCHGGADTTVMRDYWRPANTSELLLDCYAKNICLGGNLVKCETGYGGRLCTFCEAGYFRFGNFFCLPCGNTIWGVFRGILVILGTAVFLIVMILGNLRNTANKKSALSIHFRIFLNYNQITMLMSSLQIKWPVDLLKFFEGLKMTGNAGQFAFSNECITGDSSITYIYQKVLVMALVPFVLIILTVLVWGTISIVKRSTEYLHVHVVCSLIVILLAIQPMVLQSCLQLFPCVEVEAGSMWLLHDMRVVCWEGEHTSYALGVALPAILIWCLVTPLVFLVLLYRQRKHLNDPVNIRRIGFLYSGYHPHFYFWEFVVVLRKSVMVIVANIMVTATTHAQSQVAIVITWFFTILQYKEMPFESSFFNRTEFLSLLSSLVTVIAGALYLSDLRTQPGAYYAMLIVVFAFNALFMFIWVMLLAIYCGRGKSHKVANWGKWLEKLSEK